METIGQENDVHCARNQPSSPSIKISDSNQRVCRSIKHRSRALKVPYRKSFGSDSIRWSVPSQIRGIDKSANRWRWLPRAVFSIFRENASSDRHALKNSFVEHSKSYRLVSILIDFRWNKTLKLNKKWKRRVFCAFYCPFSYEFHDSAAQASVFWVRSDRSSDLKVKWDQNGANQGEP